MFRREAIASTRELMTGLQRKVTSTYSNYAQMQLNKLGSPQLVQIPLRKKQLSELSRFSAILAVFKLAELHLSMLSGLLLS